MHFNYLTSIENSNKFDESISRAIHWLSIKMDRKAGQTSIAIKPWQPTQQEDHEQYQHTTIYLNTRVFRGCPNTLREANRFVALNFVSLLLNNFFALICTFSILKSSSFLYGHMTETVYSSWDLINITVKVYMHHSEVIILEQMLTKLASVFVTAFAAKGRYINRFYITLQSYYCT